MAIRADSRAVEVPSWGQYPLVHARMTAPANRLVLGYGPAVFLGVFDLRPDDEPYQAAVHRSLQPRAMRRGATLRWCAPRQTRIDALGAVQTLQPAFADSMALSLYVGGLDVLPSSQDWVTGAWPGVPVGTSPFMFDKKIANVPSLWQMGLAFQRPQGGAGQLAITAGAAGQYGIVEQNDGFGFLRLVGGMPALELLSYAGAPWAEADLGELAGGTRYVAAWLRSWWSRREGVDPWVGASYYVPYVIADCEAKRPVHRESWHCAYPLVPREGVAALADVYDDGARFQVSSPVAGAWRVGVEQNGDLADNDVFVGLELRGSTILSRAGIAVGPADHGLSIGPTAVHSGAGVLSVGVPLGGDVDACLVHVAVSRS